MKPKIIILTASYGNGHVQVAKALYNECLQRAFLNAKIVNLYSESHPMVTELTEKLYKKSFTLGKQMYRLFYYGTDKMSNKKVFKWYYSYGFKRLAALIEEENPDILINTFPINVVPEFRKKTGIVIPTFHILTDYCLHRLWLHSEVDKYYVSTSELKTKLYNLGVQEHRVKVSGIPIRPSFEKVLEPSILMKKYKLDSNRKLVLLIAGAHGVLQNLKELCEDLLSNTSYQIAVICGNNESLRNELLLLNDRYGNRFSSFGYIEQIDELFRLAHCIITKPGGITLTEAASIGAPLVLYKPVPGQESENALFFQKKGAAALVNKKEEMMPAVSSIVENQEQFNRMKEALHAIYRPNSAKFIVEDILKESSMIKTSISFRKPVS